MKHGATGAGFSQRAGSSAPVPAYYLLQKHIKEKIENGDWKPGDAIPPERLIAAESSLSVGTVKKALQNLVHEGLLRRVQGKGTFVAGTVLSRGSLRYYRLARDFNDTYAELSVGLLGLKETRGPDAACAALGLRRGEKVFEVRRVFSAGGRPLVYALSYLTEKLFGGFTKLPASVFEKSTLYETIERLYGLPCVRNEELFAAAAAGRAAAEILGVRPGHPLLHIMMRSFTYKDVPYEYRESYCITDDRRVFAEI